MTDESRAFWHSVTNGQVDPSGFIEIDTTKLTRRGSLLDEPLRLNSSSSYHSNEFSQYLNKDSAYLGSAGELFQNLQSRLSTWMQASPTVLGLHQDFTRTTNVADEYRLQALEAGEHILENVQKDAVQIFGKTSDALSQKAQAFVAANPELVGRVDELSHQVTEVVDQVTDDVARNLKSVAWKALSTIYQGLKVAYDGSDLLSQELPGEWKRFTGEMAERSLQTREAVQSVFVKAVDGLRKKPIDAGVPTNNALSALTIEDFVDKTTPLTIKSDATQIHAASLEGDIVATASAIVRSGAGRNFQDTKERYSFKSKVHFDAWATGEMVDYTKELGTKSDLWYRIAGTDRWISSAIIHTDANLHNQSTSPNSSTPKVAEETPFKGRIIAMQANVRSGAGTQFADVGDRFKGQIVEFDGRVKGEFIDYRSTLGTASDEWLRIKGTNEMISAALISSDLTEAPSTVNTPTSTDKAVNQTAINLDLPVYREENPFWRAGYGSPNCTWYVNGRLKQLGYQAGILDKILGNAHEWDNQAIAAGATVSNEPKVGRIAVWEPGRGGASNLGHVAVIEQVNADGSIVISESNWNGQTYNTRTIRPQTSAWADHFISVPQGKDTGKSPVSNTSDPSEKHKTINTAGNDTNQDLLGKDNTGGSTENIDSKQNALLLPRTGASSDEKEFTFDEVLNSIKTIEGTVPEKQNLWWKEYDPYAVSNTLRRKGKDKYWKNSKNELGDGDLFNWVPISGEGGNSFDWVPGWNNRGSDTYAKAESLLEFVKDNGDDRVIKLANGILLPVSHFFAALSFQFGNLVQGVSSCDNTYAGDLGSVMGAMCNPTFWLGDHAKNYSNDKVCGITWEEAFKEKVGAKNDQLDGDIAAHVIAALVKEEKIKVSEALERMSKMSRKEVFEVFIRNEFVGYELSQLQEKSTADNFKQALEDKVHWFLRKNKVMSEGEGERGSFITRDDDLKKVADYFLNYLTSVLPQSQKSQASSSHASSYSTTNLTTDKTQENHGYGL